MHQVQANGSMNGKIEEAKGYTHMQQDQSTEPEIDTRYETAPHEPFPIVSLVSEKQSEFTQKVHPVTVIHEINIFYKKKFGKLFKKKLHMEVKNYNQRYKAYFDI